jgi:AraC-like DNA-binding protein
MLASSSPALSRVRARGVQGIIDIVRRRYGEGLSLGDLQRASGFRQSTLARRFREQLAVSPMRWLWTLRVAIAVELILARPSARLGDVAAECGFASPAHFTRKFTRLLRTTPSEFRSRLQSNDAPPPNAEELHAQAGLVIDAALRRTEALLGASMQDPTTSPSAPPPLRVSAIKAADGASSAPAAEPPQAPGLLAEARRSGSAEGEAT